MALVTFAFIEDDTLELWIERGVVRQVVEVRHGSPTEYHVRPLVRRREVGGDARRKNADEIGVIVGDRFLPLRWLRRLAGVKTETP